MTRPTKDELKQIHQMREEDRAKNAREVKAWNAAGVGYSENITEYAIQYRYETDGEMSPWFGCSPFYDPIRLNPECTEDKFEAYEMAAKLLAGEWAVYKQATPGDTRIDEVQVVERHSVATVIKRLP